MFAQNMVLSLLCEEILHKNNETMVLMNRVSLQRRRRRAGRWVAWIMAWLVLSSLVVTTWLVSHNGPSAIVDGTLGSLVLEQATLSPLQQLVLVSNVAQATARVHEQDILHADLMTNQFLWQP
jgi:hypothetical protein